MLAKKLLEISIFLGSVSNNAGDGQQNISEILNLHGSKLYHNYSTLSLFKCARIFLELNSKELCQSYEKERENRFLAFMSSIKREIRYFFAS